MGFFGANTFQAWALTTSLSIKTGKITSSAVLDKDENLLWSGLQWHQSCHNNEMTPLPNLRAATVVNQEKVWFVLGWNFSGANKENEKKNRTFHICASSKCQD